MSKKYKYEIEISGDGGEFIAGEVEQEFFEALEENGISIEDYAEGDYDDEQFKCIPEDIRPFDPGGWFNIHPYIVWRNLCDESRMELVVWDKTDGECEDVYRGGPYQENRHTSDNWTCDDLGEESFSIYDPGSKWEGKYVYSCQRDENGMFFSCEFELDEPFDPRKLCLMTVNLNELDMISKVVYFNKLDEEGEPDYDSGYVELEDVGDHETEINGATHELRQL